MLNCHRIARQLESTSKPHYLIRQNGRKLQPKHGRHSCQRQTLWHVGLWCIRNMYTRYADVIHECHASGCMPAAPSTATHMPGCYHCHVGHQQVRQDNHQSQNRSSTSMHGDDQSAVRDGSTKPWQTGLLISLTRTNPAQTPPVSNHDGEPRAQWMEPMPALRLCCHTSHRPGA